MRIEGHELRRVRKSNGWSLELLGKKIDRSPQTIAGWETRDPIPEAMNEVLFECLPELRPELTKAEKKAESARLEKLAAEYQAGLKAKLKEDAAERRAAKKNSTDSKENALLGGLRVHPIPSLSLTLKVPGTKVSGEHTSEMFGHLAFTVHEGGGTFGIAGELRRLADLISRFDGAGVVEGDIVVLLRTS